MLNSNPVLPISAIAEPHFLRICSLPSSYQVRTKNLLFGLGTKLVRRRQGAKKATVNFSTVSDFGRLAAGTGIRNFRIRISTPMEYSGIYASVRKPSILDSASRNQQLKASFSPCCSIRAAGKGCIQNLLWRPVLPQKSGRVC